MSTDIASIRAPRRTYQACIRCRQRKARCIVDTNAVGSDISCLRCRRERKECHFTAERSQKPERRPGQLPGSAHSSAQSVGRAPFQTRTATGQSRCESTSNTLTEQVARTAVSNQAEALDLLFEAAQECRSTDGILVGEHDDRRISHGWPDAAQDAHSSSRQSHTSWAAATHPLSRPSEETLKIWSTSRFVKKRWLSAQEAITYVDLFFRNMVPFTPIIDNFYADHSNSAALVTTEPVLYATILTLSTRYHLLNGDGLLSRGYFLHNRLWLYCQSLIQRVIWGQEKRVSGKTRSLGTVEALLLMTEWHTRSLHLPPNIDAWGSEDDGDSAPDMWEGNKQHQVPSRWLEGIVEPMKRSDRMSWFLLQSAATLADELGVFDEARENSSNTSTHRDSQTENSGSKRRYRLRYLLYVYMNQLGCRVGSLRLIPHILSIPPDAVMRGPDTQFDQGWSNVMLLHVDLTRLARSSSDLLFSSKRVTRGLVLSGDYKRILETFKLSLEQWWEKYSTVPGPATLRALLSIEFRYTKVSIYSLVLQAVAERKEACHTGEASDGFLSSILSLQPGDYDIMQDIMNECKRTLDSILSFAENGGLKYLPVRTYTRTVTSCIFLLKTLALGVREDELDISLDLIDKIAQALRTHIVDDLHQGGIFASLLERYTKSFRERFVRVGKLSTKDNHANVARPHHTPRNSIFTEGRERQAFESPSHDYGSENTAETPSTFQAINDLDSVAGEWLTHPFDSSLAPFGLGVTQSMFVFDEELNFVWNNM